MKKILPFLLIIIVAFAGFYLLKSCSDGKKQPEQKSAPIVLKNHSSNFNKSISVLLNAYFGMKDAFVESDSSKAKASCIKFIQLLDSIPVDELKKDSSSIIEIVKTNITDLKMNAESLIKQNDLIEMRHDFSMISEILYPSFFRAINYEGEKMYWQNCPMAFGEGKEANWISNTEEVYNPYLGKAQPEMLHCGEIKDTIKAK